MDEIPDYEWLASHPDDDDQFDDDFLLDVEPPSPPSSPPSDKAPQRRALSLPPKPSPFKPQPRTSPTSNKRAGSDLLNSISILSDGSDSQFLSSKGTSRKRSRNGLGEAQNEKLDQSECPEVGSTGSENAGGCEGEKTKEGSDDDEEWLKFTPLQNIMKEMDAVQEERQEKILSRFATDIDGNCVPITGLDGERVYAKIRSSVDMDEEVSNRKLNLERDHNGLLQEPVRVLMEKVEQEQFSRALQGSVEGEMTEVVPSTEPVTSEQLWVEKYAPSSFTELLSDERTNREVLLWLKQWDSSVFGFDIKSTTDDVLTSLRRHSTGSQHHKQSSKSFSRNNRESRFNRVIQKTDNEPDEENNTSLGIQEMWDKKHKNSGPPEQKVLLLCGAPGLGKTTLAHVAARHCGYHVVEINASDDRSASTVKAKILDVVQMNSVIADSKPKCLVVDEIDGALGDGKGAVEVILQLLSAERKSDTGKENISQEANSGGKSSRKRPKSSVLLRPVICICNDLYAPALRPLRQVAKVHIFVQPTVSRVVNRLKYICNKERVKTSSIALSALAECTECDIRSCLNTLQFLNKKNEVLNVMDINSQVVGRKDAAKSAFDIWKEIFQKKKEKSGKRSNNSSSSTSKDFDYLYSMISNRGDSELILDGIHENIYQLHYVDPLMQKTVQCLDNLGVSDVTHRYMMRTQKMSLLVYQPPVAIFIHRMIAQLERKDIEWPKSLQRQRTTLAERMDMFHSWHSGISPYISRHLSTKSFVEDSISPLLHILSPQSLRPVALHLLSDREKSDLTQIVNTMVSYAITYKTIKADRTDTWRHENALEATTIALDPPLINFVHFKDHNSCHIDLALVIKQVLVHEVEKQKIMQGSFSKSINLHGEENSVFAKNSAGTRLPFKSSYRNGTAEKNTNQKSPAAEKPGLSKAVDEIKSVRKTKKPSGGGLTSFFNRVKKVGDEVTEVTQSDVPKSATSRRDAHPFLFKFNEGFTNAVKRPVRMREFLL